MSGQSNRVLASVLVVAAASSAMAQPTVPSDYAIEEYVKIQGTWNPLGMAFCPDRDPAWAGQLFVCMGNDEQGRAVRTLYRVPGKGRAELFARPADALPGMAFAPAGSGYRGFLYAPVHNQTLVACYDRDGSASTFAETGRGHMYTLRFGPGGRWGGEMYVLDNQDSRGAIIRYRPDGSRSICIADLPSHAMGFDFGPGGAWGRDIYVGCSGSGIYRLDPNGVLSDFVAYRDVPVGGWHVGHAFDTTGNFGGDLFFSALGDSKVFQVDPNGRVSQFAGGFRLGAGNQSSGRIVFGPDGAMYVGDGENGIVWRISRNRLGLEREAAMDRVVLAGGQAIRGTIAGDVFVLETAFGKVELKAQSVTGMAAAGAGGAVRCLLSDGQIVHGRLPHEGVRIAPVEGNARSLPAGEFRQWSRRVSGEHPLNLQPAGPLLVTKDGQELLVEANGFSLVLRTRWGVVRLGPALLAELVSLDADAAAAWAAGVGSAMPPAVLRARLVNGSILTGVPEGGDLVLTARLGMKMTLAPDRFARLRLGRQGPEALWTRAEMEGGDVLVGELGKESLKVRTAAGPVQVPPQDVRELSRGRSSNAAEFRLRRWGGDDVVGVLEGNDLPFSLRPGLEVRLPAGRLLRLTCPVPGSPEEFARRVAALVEKLGAERFQDREAATKALIEMGPVVVPMLEPFAEHKDPEVRERVRLILEKLRGPATAPPPPADQGVPVQVAPNAFIVLPRVIIIHQEAEDRALPENP